VVGLVVLHDDADFERIAAVGGARHEWVVPQGSSERSARSAEVVLEALDVVLPEGVAVLHFDEHELVLAGFGDAVGRSPGDVDGLPGGERT